MAYALLKILNVCRAVAIFVRLDKLNSFKKLQVSVKMICDFIWFIWASSDLWFEDLICDLTGDMRHWFKSFFSNYLWFRLVIWFVICPSLAHTFTTVSSSFAVEPQHPYSRRYCMEYHMCRSSGRSCSYSTRLIRGRITKKSYDNLTIRFNLRYLIVS